jgi:hypothetical protein
MSLRDAQLELSRWVRAPQGVAAALAEEDAAETGAHSENAVRRLENLIRSDEALDATRRLEIYANAYFSRILGVLKADYPALLALLGEAAFNDLVTSYLLVEPSRSPSLRHAGLRLADFLRTHEAAAGIRRRWPWAADLAAFEWARIDVFDAADGSVLTREALTSIAPGDFGALFLRLGPWVSLRTFAHPVERLWRVGIHEQGPRLGDVTGEAHLLIWRRDERTLHRSVDPHEEGALALLSPGSRFDALCEWAGVRMGDEEAPSRAAAWLEQWLSDGLLIVADQDSDAVTDN